VWTSGTTISVTYAGLTAGRGIVIGVVWYHATATISSITLTSEANATLLAGTLVRNAALNDTALQIAHLREITVGGTKTITATLSATPSAGAIFAQEYSGQDTVDFSDAATNTGTGNSANPSITVTTNTDNDLIYSINVTNAEAQTAGAGFTLVSTNTAFWWEATEDDVDVGVAGAKTVPWTHAAGDWAISAAGFKPASTLGAAQFMVATRGLAGTGGMIGRDYI